MNSDIGTRTSIIKSVPLDSLNKFDNYEGDQIESKSKVEVIGSGNLKDAIEEYKTSEGVFTLLSHPTFILDPREINLFLQIIVEDELNAAKTTQFDGEYITSLIKKSYDFGNNCFTINTSNYSSGSYKSYLTFLGRKLIGTQKSPIKINLIGDFGDHVAASSEYLEMKIEGSVKSHFASFSKYFKGEIFGDIGPSLASEAENLEVITHGRVGFYPTQKSEDSIYVAYNKGTAIDLSRAVLQDSGQLKSYSKKRSKQVSMFDKIDKNNKVYLIKENGDEVLVEYNRLDFSLKVIGGNRR